MAKKLDYKTAHKLFVCDPVKATLYWRETKEPAGKRVKWSKSTRVIIRWEGRNYLQDDLIWLLKYHRWPDYYNDDTTTATTKTPKAEGRMPRGVKVEVKYCPKTTLFRVYTRNQGTIVGSSAYVDKESARISVEKKRAKLKNKRLNAPKKTAFLYRKVALFCDDEKGWRVLIRKGGKIVSNKEVNVLLYYTDEARKRFAAELQQRYRMEDEDAFFVMYKMERYEVQN